MNHMSKRSIFVATVLALSIQLIVDESALAQSENDGMTQAITVFNGGGYPQAAQLFTQILQSAPQNQLAHYYLGVCWHCMGRVPEAMAEYSWVTANCQDPELLRRAEMGLQVLSRGQQQPLNAVQPPATWTPPPRYNLQTNSPDRVLYPASALARPASQPSMPTGSSTGWLSQTGAQKAAEAIGSSVSAAGPTPKIVDLYTSWCGWCRVFEPIFQQAQAKYGNQIRFERLNAEAPANRSLVKKYNVLGYPTVLFFDPSGRLVKRIDGAPQSMMEFESDILGTFPAIKPF